jgi:hypothetical protein
MPLIFFVDRLCVHAEAAPKDKGVQTPVQPKKTAASM